MCVVRSQKEGDSQRDAINHKTTNMVVYWSPARGLSFSEGYVVNSRDLT